MCTAGRARRTGMIDLLLMPFALTKVYGMIALGVPLIITIMPYDKFIPNK